MAIYSEKIKTWKKCKKVLKSSWQDSPLSAIMFKPTRWNKRTADKKNLDNWTIDNDPEDSLRENSERISERWYQTKNSKTGKEKLVVFLTGLKRVFKSRGERRLSNLYESLILAQDERWRRA